MSGEGRVPVRVYDGPFEIWHFFEEKLLLEGGIGEDIHVGHGEDELFPLVVDGYVLGRAEAGCCGFVGRGRLRLDT